MKLRPVEVKRKFVSSRWLLNIENIQRHAIRCLETLIGLPYQERLKMPDIQTLELQDNEAEGFNFAKF